MEGNACNRHLHRCYILLGLGRGIRGINGNRGIPGIRAGSLWTNRLTRCCYSCSGIARLMSFIAGDFIVSFFALFHLYVHSFKKNTYISII